MKKFLFYLSAVAVMFSSCSKDATEVSAPSLEKGVKAFSASIDVESENSTRLVVEGTKYLWSPGDAIGVATDTDLDANVFVSTPVGGQTPDFVVDQNDRDRWIDGWKDNESPLYLYFPYKDDTEFTVGGLIDLTISPDQRYAPGSFYKNSVPAVGYAEKYTGADQQLKLTIPTSLIQVWFDGIGATEQIRLSIKNSNDKFYILNGNATVDVTAEKPAFIISGNESPTADVASVGNYVTVSFGNKPGELDYAEAGGLPVHFIVPTGLEMNGATLIFEKLDANNQTLDTEEYEMSVAEESRKLAPNRRMNLRKDGQPVYITFGMDGKHVIKNEIDFLMYAYLNQPAPVGDEFEVSDVHESYILNTYGIASGDTAWIRADKTPVLDFGKTESHEAYDIAWATAEHNKIASKNAAAGAENPTDEDDFLKKFYRWYISNGGAIESLATGNVVADSETAPVTIKNLKVKGTGFTAGASLENLVLENIAVEGAGSQVGLVAANNTINDMTIKNVSIAGDKNSVTNTQQASSTYTGGIYGTYYASSNTIKSATAVTVSGVGKGQLYGQYVPASGVSTLACDTYAVNAESTTPMINMLASGTGKRVLKVNGDGLKLANVVAKVADNLSILVNGTSYWFGNSYEPNNDGVFTAEELAYVLTKNENREMQLTNDIDMQGKELLIPVNTSTITKSIDGTAKKDGEVVTDVYSISNLTAKSDAQPTAANYTTLFGTIANLSNVELNTVKFFAAGKTSNVGLANKGTAKNVTVDGLTIDCANITSNSDISFITIGGIFATATPSDIDNVTVKDVKINNPENTTVGLVAGVLTLPAGTDTHTVGKINVYGTLSPDKQTSTNVIAKGGHYLSLSNSNVNNVDKYSGTLASAYGLTKYYYTPFGAIDVKCAVWANNKAQSLTVAEGSVYQVDATKGNRLAASYWFPAGFLEKAQSVAVGNGVSDKHTYVFTTNGNSGTQGDLNKVGFEYKIN